jgi:hypothetical protein
MRHGPTPAAQAAGFRRLLKIALSMILGAIAVAWIAALAYPLAIKVGLTESAASRLPNYGLVAGAALGLATRLAESLRHFLYALFLMFICASVFWFYAVEVEAVVVAMGVPARIAEWLSPAAFCFGLLLVAFAFSVEPYEKFTARLQKRKDRAGK